MVLTVIVSTGATLWTGQLGLSRLLFSAARDKMLPHAFARVHPKFGTPSFSIAVVTLGALGLALLTGLAPNVRSGLNEVDNITSILLGLTFIVTGAACVVHFIRKGVPLTDTTRVVLPAVGTVSMIAILVADFGSQPFVDRIVAVGCLVLGVIYAFFTKKK
jgi:amino acid transporter